ncbi:HemY protein [Nicoletella semolina]|uniref:HemY protein n=1 Tax=Nicoletella semolina TaxID=271160 RepID=A0A4R2NCY5_9PAST|nr:heme biosynthesis HemY N-terminal domain-containing protein [Nicoletella semolina]MDH2924201.1 heme biosynthesis protein HemY [Nicoletella semolina]TCP18902.1 HemY protein [Nicoletella semolina]
MFRVLFLMILALVGLILGPNIAGNQGYVRIETDTKVIEMSLVVLVFFFVAALAVVYLLEWLFSRLFRLSRGAYQWVGKRKRKKAQQQTLEGLMKMTEGDYSKAEKLISKNAKHADEPILNFIKAAEAAQQRGDDLNANHYLLEAAKIAGPNNIAVEIARTQVLLQQNKLPAARSSVDSLLELAPNNIEALRLGIEIYQRSGAYKALDNVLENAKQVSFLSATEYESLMQQVEDGLLDEVMNEEGQEGLLRWWEHQPSRRRRSVYVRAGLVKRLIESGDHLSAEKIALETVKKFNDDQLADLFGVLVDLQAEPEGKLVQMLQKRAQKAENLYSDDYARVLGYLFTRAGLFEQAKPYFVQLLDHQECVSNDRIMALYMAEKTGDIVLVDRLKQENLKDINMNEDEVLALPVAESRNNI